MTRPDLARAALTQPFGHIAIGHDTTRRDPVRPIEDLLRVLRQLGRFRDSARTILHHGTDNAPGWSAGNGRFITNQALIPASAAPTCHHRPDAPPHGRAR